VYINLPVNEANLVTKWHILQTVYSRQYAFSALTLLVGHQEEHATRKK